MHKKYDGELLPNVPLAADAKPAASLQLKAVRHRGYLVCEGWLAGESAAGFANEWAFEHRDELMEDWELARQHKPLKDIPGLV